VNGFWFVLAALRSGATFVAALGCAGLLAQFSSAPPIFIALVASLVVAGTSFILGTNAPFDSEYFAALHLGTYLVAFLVGMAGPSGTLRKLCPQLQVSFASRWCRGVCPSRSSAR
jgi:hypothetical protein